MFSHVPTVTSPVGIPRGDVPVSGVDGSYGIVGAVVSTGTVQSSASVGLTLADPELESSVSAILRDVEAVLIDSVHSANPLVTEAARHLVDAGGKRVRPLLVGLAAQFGDPPAREVVVA